MRSRNRVPIFQPPQIPVSIWRWKNQKPAKPKRSVFLQKVEQELRETLGTKVVVHSRKEGGSIEVEFYSPEDLNRLIEIFDKLKD